MIEVDNCSYEVFSMLLRFLVRVLLTRIVCLCIVPHCANFLFCMVSTVHGES